MVSDTILKKAISLAKRKKLDESIKMLEAEVFRYQDSYIYYYILGTSCLYAGDFGGAFTYFSRAKNIKFREPNTLLGMAVLFLRRGDTDKALDLYLDVEDIDPANRIAKRALKVIRKYGGTETLDAWLNSGKVHSLYPPLPRTKFSVKSLIIPGIVIAAGLGIFIGIRQVPVFMRGGLEESVLEKTERDNPVETGGVYRYNFSSTEVLSHYNQARKFFNEYRDEAAKRELNRILESNASEPVKNKARLLREYTSPPDFSTLKDRFSYAEVKADPLLYRDCHILWRGSAANVRVGTDTVSFDLLVGYDTRTVMEGSVSVELDFPAELSTIQPLEVLGRVVPLGPERFMIAGTGIHQSPLN
ncbi:MAG: tetratricopeptide repeat protein [Spirochaetaceae bacterium]|jgi:tetratricopeptide (TPR) repeat protein|nr:tetratricopeptide repeat protein [Spirochaetaceae bacterium]